MFFTDIEFVALCPTVFNDVAELNGLATFYYYDAVDAVELT
jgi:hypothetical protein